MCYSLQFDGKQKGEMTSNRSEEALKGISCKGIFCTVKINLSFPLRLWKTDIATLHSGISLFYVNVDIHMLQMRWPQSLVFVDWSLPPVCLLNFYMLHISLARPLLFSGWLKPTAWLSESGLWMVVTWRWCLRVQLIVLHLQQHRHFCRLGTRLGNEPPTTACPGEGKTLPWYTTTVHPWTFTLRGTWCRSITLQQVWGVPWKKLKKKIIKRLTGKNWRDYTLHRHRKLKGPGREN